MFQAMLLALLATEPLNLAGKWKLHHSAAGRESTRECTFTQSGNEFTGPCTSPEGPVVTITGKIDGRNVSFGYKSEHEGNPLTVNYKGAAESATRISGKVVAEEFAVEGEFSATQIR